MLHTVRSRSRMRCLAQTTQYVLCFHVYLTCVHMCVIQSRNAAAKRAARAHAAGI